MSKNNGSRNFVNYSKVGTQQSVDTNDASTETTNEESVTEQAPVAENDNNSMQPVVVCNCVAVNIRSKPEMDAEIVSTLVRGTRLYVDLKRSNRRYYGVRLEDGPEGYCIKQFVQSE